MAMQKRIAAVLGPTNTGKTHYAIERMLGYRSGIIGLPLRLLAREVYDKIVGLKGPSVVALVTGEERIVPPRAQYWVCTVEAMPEGMGADFVAVDEIQLCADPERGHVFTDRLMRMRGTHETLFLGSDTMRGPISALVPGVEFVRRERMSQLAYSGSKKISRLPNRTAIVGFSIDNVYAIAELLKRQKGGAAVVMGALSPRTRNAQVELYQNGEVDYLVATDAIGMGLNLDIDHVAFSSLSKFDGRRMRPLMPNELAQIAGRAGRGMSHGTFGVTGEAGPIHEDVADAICNHSFTPLKKLNWRNPALQFGSIDALERSLDQSPTGEVLMKAREADDLRALRALASDTEVRARASDGQSVQLLWNVCRIPDFRGISPAEHAGLLGVIFGHLHQTGHVPDDFLARQVNRIDRTDGDIDTLSKRLAYIRTWTYVAQRRGWVKDEDHWRGATRAVEDSLSDALHERLTQRFVDRRTSVLLRRLKQKEALLAEVNDQGEVTVEGHTVGKLEGFRFRQDKDATGQEAKTLRQASLQALAPHFHLRADRFYNAPDTEIDFTEQGGLMWGDQAVGKLAKGDDPLKPRVVAFVDEEAGPDVAQKVERRLQHFMDRKIAALFEPLIKMRDDEALTGLSRGFAFRLVESLGVIPRAEVADDVKALDQDARGALRKHGVRFGQYTIFMPLLLKPAPTRLRLVLWSLANGLEDFPEAPPPGLVTVPNIDAVPAQHYTLAGYRKAGARAIRIDMLERLADMIRSEDSRGGFEAKADMLSITGMTLEQFADLMGGLGYRAEKGERQKVKPVDVVVAPEEGAAPVAEDTVSTEDTPVFDKGQEAAPGAQVGAADAPEAADLPEAVQKLDDHGEAPIATDPAETASADVIADTPAEEILPGTAPDAGIAGPETEVFYTFTWGGNRGNQQRRGGGQQRGPRRDAKPNEQRGGDKPRGKGKPKGKGGPKGDRNGPKTFSARPPKKEKAIDPDNPFAAALMGLKDKS
ncbi:helicase-related protein [Tropicibacter naphthalenivorans]|uniref:Superfamily II RNA helicase n=1 Tax=Tropicibacter naphthalenivorans TaxID=441103 RepID=A0A0P1GQ13_9RHOB|nr:helicase-related protein [Tropicibacter naphthalenivorans]CUH76224.1 Superfamily II RNA helicase [Tropicibacter naphthalenivorans]SMC39307.1 ATP-dependent RNA helicase SUPV3L1/SUV3 [Tropicibacter naphthalenivorans]